MIEERVNELSGTEPLPARPDVPYLASLITPEWRTEEALRLLLADLGGAVEFGTALSTFAQSEHQSQRGLLRFRFRVKIHAARRGITPGIRAAIVIPSKCLIGANPVC